MSAVDTLLLSESLPDETIEELKADLEAKDREEINRIANEMNQTNPEMNQITTDMIRLI